MRIFLSILLTILAGAAAAANDRCVVGDWQMDTRRFAMEMKEGYGFKQAYIIGDVVMSIKSNGDAAVQIAQFEFHGRDPGGELIKGHLFGHLIFKARMKNKKLSFRSLDEKVIGAFKHMAIRNADAMPFDAQMYNLKFANQEGKYLCRNNNLFLNLPVPGMFPMYWKRAGRR